MGSRDRRLASLPMYDLPELARATESWWRGLAGAMTREGLRDVPARLTRPDDHTALWRGPGLLFSQTCGYPLTHAYKDDLRLVATPAYGAPGCRGAEYCSVIVVRDDQPATGLADLKGSVAAYNALDSQSGYSALRAAVAPLAGGKPFFARLVESGGHAMSLELVGRGEAEVCAVDCVTFALLARYRPAAVRGLRILAESAVAPGLPYVTGAAIDEDTLSRLRAAVFAALADPSLVETRAALMIEGAEVLRESAYDRILELEQEARDLGYPALA